MQHKMQPNFGVSLSTCKPRLERLGPGRTWRLAHFGKLPSTNVHCLYNLS